jgi:hypothetical protein
MGKIKEFLQRRLYNLENTMLVGTATLSVLTAPSCTDDYFNQMFSKNTETISVVYNGEKTTLEKQKRFGNMVYRMEFFTDSIGSKLIEVAEDYNPNEKERRFSLKDDPGDRVIRTTGNILSNKGMTQMTITSSGIQYETKSVLDTSVNKTYTKNDPATLEICKEELNKTDVKYNFFIGLMGLK